VDLVYNRLTDFDLSDPAHAALHDAYVTGGTVVTPHPRAHALFADKRNLITLGDDGLLASWGVSPQDRRILQAAIPRTEQVHADSRPMRFGPAGASCSSSLWPVMAPRPPTGATSSPAASGARSSPATFVAQDLVPPSERLVEVNGQPQRLKLDVRAYTYRGDPVAGRAHLDRPDHQLPHAGRRVFARRRAARSGAA
jgi:hypothetical protein